MSDSRGELQSCMATSQPLTTQPHILTCSCICRSCFALETCFPCHVRSLSEEFPREPFIVRMYIPMPIIWLPILPREPFISIHVRMYASTYIHTFHYPYTGHQPKNLCTIICVYLGMYVQPCTYTYLLHGLWHTYMHHTLDTYRECVCWGMWCMLHTRMMPFCLPLTWGESWSPFLCHWELSGGHLSPSASFHTVCSSLPDVSVLSNSETHVGMTHGLDDLYRWSREGMSEQC